jgi:hypothetical protein
VVKDTLDQIGAAFFEKPAVITSHRINFCGSLHTENRDRNLKLLHQLLSEITKRWSTWSLQTPFRWHKP